MKRYRLLSILLLVLAVGSYGAITILNDTTEQSAQSMPAEQSENTSSKEPKAINTVSVREPLAKGAYLPYSEEVVSSAAGKTVLFFHADWCRQCRDIESGILQQGVPDGITIVKVNYDKANELRKKYEVTLQTTFVVVKSDGTAIQKFVAYDTPTFDYVLSKI